MEYIYQRRQLRQQKSTSAENGNVRNMIQVIIDGASAVAYPYVIVNIVNKCFMITNRELSYLYPIYWFKCHCRHYLPMNLVFYKGK